MHTHTFFNTTAKAAALALAASACSEVGAPETETGTIDSVQAELSVNDCAGVAADATFFGKIDPPLITPQTYDTCTKGYVVDVIGLEPEYTGTGDLMDSRVTIQWADTPITNPKQCGLSKVMGIFYEPGLGTSTSTGGPGSWTLVKEETMYGHWTDACGGTCVLDVNLTRPNAGGLYRIAASGRSYRNNTRKVSIGTYKPLD